MSNNNELTMNLPVRMVHQATRYLLGRDTNAVTEHVEWLISNWFSLPTSARYLIEHDVEDAFYRFRADPSALGHPTLNKPTWERLRELWSIGD